MKERKKERWKEGKKEREKEKKRVLLLIFLNFVCVCSSVFLKFL